MLAADEEEIFFFNRRFKFVACSSIDACRVSLGCSVDQILKLVDVDANDVSF
jgi:hypothetical protein